MQTWTFTLPCQPPGWYGSGLQQLSGAIHVMCSKCNRALLLASAPDARLEGGGDASYQNIGGFTGLRVPGCQGMCHWGDLCLLHC